LRGEWQGQEVTYQVCRQHAADEAERADVLHFEEER